MITPLSAMSFPLLFTSVCMHIAEQVYFTAMISVSKLTCILYLTEFQEAASFAAPIANSSNDICLSYASQENNLSMEVDLTTVASTTRSPTLPIRSNNQACENRGCGLKYIMSFDKTYLNSKCT